MSDILSSKALVGKSIYDQQSGKKLGRIRALVFHESQKRCVGLLVKRPDVAWMFPRKDLFLSLQAISLHDKTWFASSQADLRGRQACKHLGIDLDRCILWIGLPVLDTQHEPYGHVGSCKVDRSTGDLVSLRIDAGLGAKVLLGEREIPAVYVEGFALTNAGGGLRDSKGTLSEEQGALIVSEEVASLVQEGGLAEKAGDAYYHTIAPAAEKLGKKTASGVQAGVRSAGRHIGRTQGALSAFKDEYTKARKN